MTRTANPNAKTKQVVAKPKLEWETEFTAFKEICARNGLSMSQEIYDRAIKSFLRDHNYPPGNSQTLMKQFTQEKLDTTICQMDSCSNKAEYLCFSAFPYGKDVKLCNQHRIDEERKGNVRGSKKLDSTI